MLRSSRREAEVARVAEDRLDPRRLDVAGQRERRPRDRAERVAEVALGVVAVEALGLRVGVGDADRLQERRAVGVAVAALLLGESQ